MQSSRMVMCQSHEHLEVRWSLSHEIPADEHSPEMSGEGHIVC